MNAFAHFLEGASQIMLGYGLQGVVMVALGYTTRKLYLRNCALTDARLADATAQTTALNASTAAINRMSDALIQNSKHNT